MGILSLYPDFLRALNAPPPLWPRLSAPAQGYLAGLEETYGPEGFGGLGARLAAEQAAPALRPALAPAGSYGLEELSTKVLGVVTPLLPGPPPDLYLATLLFIAPAATLNIGGRPAIALGLERFHPAPPAGGEKYWYHPGEAVEMLPHEAAHAARMQVLGLPPTPRRLSLLEMVMLEGTALTFTDLLLGRRTLATFMPADRLAWHEAHDREVRAAVFTEFGAVGMSPFEKYFAASAPVSGYYVGYSLCREYLERYGSSAVRELVALPSHLILARLSSASPPPLAQPGSQRL